MPHDKDVLNHSLNIQPTQNTAFSLPIHSQDVLGKDFPRTLELELKHGNGDLIKVLNILGIVGPFKVLNPWELQDEEGRHLINAGGYSALPFGEMYPPLIAFLQEYLKSNQSSSLPQGVTSAWRAALETNLIALLARQAPSHSDSQVFFSNSGAEAIEAAIKFAKAARTKARYIINFTRAYHGKTYGALSLTPNEEYQSLFRPLMPNVITLPYGDSHRLHQTIKQLGSKNIIAIIVEPIQGEGGVIIPPADFLPAINSIREQGILIIADEIQTGLGRSGYYFASLAMGLEPDIITLAKPLGGGLVAVGATIARKTIYKKLLGGLESKRHSNTFGGGSLAMAVGLKSLELIMEEKLAERSKLLGEQGLKRLQEIQSKYPGYIKDVRGAGMLFAIHLRHVVKPSFLPLPAEQINQFGTALALRTMHLYGLHVCFTTNSSRVIRLTPALNMPIETFNTMFNRLEQVAQNHQQAWRMLPQMPQKRLLDLIKLALQK